MHSGRSMWAGSSAACFPSAHVTPCANILPQLSNYSYVDLAVGSCPPASSSHGSCKPTLTGLLYEQLNKPPPKKHTKKTKQKNNNKKTTTVFTKQNLKVVFKYT